MPKADTSSITSRRTLLATAALIAPTSLLPAIAAGAAEDVAVSGPDAALLALARRIAEADERSNRREREL
ncbi:MAG: hypothetical protein QOJ50_3056, partial [Cryptosporangiaceae bacterium]|nr:hypothetical protein [Cryptosporangiaceae bacterium]